MNNKMNCQLISILLNKDNEFTDKYTSFSYGNYNFEDILDNYFSNKQMNSIRIDSNNQSICFTNQKTPISIYNRITKKYDSYYEEIHIHSNNLSSFDEFVDYINRSSYKNYIEECSNIPHYDAVYKNDFKNYELLMEPMTNEVDITKNLINTLSKNNDETIFRAIAIYFGKLVDNQSDINSDLIHKLNDIYNQNVLGTDYGFFSDNISNRILNIAEEECSHQQVMARIPSNNYNFHSDLNYDFSLDDEDYEKEYK